jgi:multidrug efflux pump
MQQFFGIIMTGVGVISLAGVVVNNAIVLIDYTNRLHQRGMQFREAIIAAGCTRLRPVLLTAITTILGLLPMVTGIAYNFHEM